MSIVNLQRDQQFTRMQILVQRIEYSRCQTMKWFQNTSSSGHLPKLDVK